MLSTIKNKSDRDLKGGNNLLKYMTYVFSQFLPGQSKLATGSEIVLDFESLISDVIAESERISARGLSNSALHAGH